METEIKLKKHRTLKGIIIYTCMFVPIFIYMFRDAFAQYSSILSMDVSQLFWPFLAQLRRDVITFFTTGQIPMMNFDYSFGTDAVTSTSVYFAPALPIYALSALFPEELLPQFITGVVVIFTYLIGLSFIYMCGYFGKDTMLCGALAPIYVFSGNYYVNGWGNPHFMFMFIAFPLMIVGLDRIIHDKKDRLLALGTGLITMTSPSFLFYVLPVAALFAAIRVYYVHKGHYFGALGKYFLKSMLYIMTGVLIGCAELLPQLYALFHSMRGSSADAAAIMRMFIPDLAEVSNIFALQDNEKSALGVCFAAMPFFLYSLTGKNAKRELRSYGIAVLVLCAFPVFTYFTNGFLYYLFRWGFVPSLLFAYVCAEYIPRLFRAEKKQILPFIALTAVYALLYTLDLEEYGFIGIFAIIVLSMIPAARRLGAGAFEGVKAYFVKLKGAAGGKGGLAVLVSAAAICFALLILLVFVISAKLYFIRIKFLVSVAVVAAAAVCLCFEKMPKRLRTALPATVLSAGFAVSLILYIPTEPTDFHGISDGYEDEFLKKLAEQAPTLCEDGRYAPAFDEDLYTSEYSQEEEEELSEEDNALLELTKEREEEIYNIYNTSQFYGVPVNCDLFYSMLDGNLMEFLARMGQDGNNTVSVNQVGGFSANDALYSLFGIRHLFNKGDNELYLYGVREEGRTDLSDGVYYTLYENPYAMPLGSVYTKLSDKEKYDSLDAAVLPFSMMRSVWLDGYDNAAGFEKDDDAYGYECPFELSQVSRGVTSDGIECFDNTISLGKDVSRCFLYLSFDGVVTKGLLDSLCDRFNVNIGELRTSEFNFVSETATMPWKRTLDHYTLSLGFIPENVDTLDFISPFAFESVRVYAVPESVFTEAFSERCEETLHNARTDINTLTGDLTLSRDSVLCINMLYSKGWTAYVDGEKADVYKANGLFIGLPLTAGKHDIKLVYHTPFIYEGAALSCAGIALIIIIPIIKTIRERKQKK